MSFALPLYELNSLLADLFPSYEGFSRDFIPIRFKDLKRTMIIAEIGINHQGELAIAKEMIKKAKECGADCAKFQKRTVDKILTKKGLDAPYENPNSFGSTYGEHKRKLELSFDDFREIKRYCDEIGILFSCSCWDEESVDFIKTLNPSFLKVASADLTNLPLLNHTAETGLPLIVSTGMANMEMVDKAVGVIRRVSDDPDNLNVVLMQCTSSYPAPFSETNLKVIKTYKRFFPSLTIGFSSHDRGIAVATCAVALGAKVIEKHFTLDRTQKGGDHQASLEPDGLRRLVRDIRAFEEALGDGIKIVQPSEKAVELKLKKSIVFARKLERGSRITVVDIVMKGPGGGMIGYDMDKVMGRIVSQDVEEDQMVTEDVLEVQDPAEVRKRDMMKAKALVWHLMIGNTGLPNI